MKLNTFMAITAVIALVFGLGFLLFPAQLIESYGVTLGEPGRWVGRYLGAALIGISAVAWLARNAEQGAALRAIVLGDLVLAALLLVVAILDMLYGQGNVLLWLNIAVGLFLTVGFGYFQFVKPVGS